MALEGRKNCEFMMVYTAHYKSPLGGITMASDGEALVGLWFNGQKHFGAGLASDCEARPGLPIFAQTCLWLETYFGGGVPSFVPPLVLKGSNFRQQVWKVLLEIPYGNTTTYGEIARKMSLSRMSAQAVGGAVGHNPISLIVPCHRVVGAGGSLTGYAGGLERKAWMLRLEGAMGERQHVFPIAENN